MKYFLGLLAVGALLGTVAFFGYSPFLKVIVHTLGASPTGTTGSVSKDYSIIFAPLATPATTTSILNTDANSRFITSDFVACQSINSSTNSGVASLVVRAATTSTATPTDISSLTNFVLNTTISTSTPVQYIASSTNPVTGDAGRIWAAGSYLTFWLLNATSTATCTIGVHTLQT